MTHVETHEFLSQTKDERIAALEQLLVKERAISESLRKPYVPKWTTIELSGGSAYQYMIDDHCIRLKGNWINPAMCTWLGQNGTRLIEEHCAQLDKERTE